MAKDNEQCKDRELLKKTVKRVDQLDRRVFLLEKQAQLIRREK